MTNTREYDLAWRSHPSGLGGEHAFINFPNGYSASVLRGGPFYTDGGTYEVAVFYNNEIVYDTPVTDDVLGHLTRTELMGALAQIEALPAREQ